MTMSEESVADVLMRAADLIEPEGAWCQGEPAEDADGCAVGALDPSAIRWCAAGALARFSSNPDGTNGNKFYHRVRRELINVLGTSTIVHWNDAPERTQAEVVAALRSAAALAVPRVGGA